MTEQSWLTVILYINIYMSTHYPLYRGATLGLARGAFTRRGTSPGAIPRWHYL